MLRPSDDRRARLEALRRLAATDPPSALAFIEAWEAARWPDLDRARAIVQGRDLHHPPDNVALVGELAGRLVEYGLRRWLERRRK